MTKIPKAIPVNTTDWIGSAAAIFTTRAFIPQAWKVWRTRHTADILLKSWPIVMANCITLLLAGAVLVMKLRFG